MEVTIGSTKAAGGSTHLDPTPDSVRVGDGTNTLAVNGDGSLNVVGLAGDLATEATLAAINTKTPALVAGRIPVDVGASISIDVADVGFDVNNFPATYPVTDNGGSLTVDGTVAVSNLPAVQPVSDNGGSLTVDGLVSISGGTITVDNQPGDPATETTLAALNSKVPAPGQWAMAQSISVAVASDQSAVPVSGTFWQATQPVSAASLPLPAGAASEATLAAISASVAGSTAFATYRNSYASASVTTGAWTQITASIGSAVRAIEIFDSSGQTLELGIGAAASETRLILIFPGGNGRLPLTIASGSRIAIRAVSGDATAGEIDINFYS